MGMTDTQRRLVFAVFVYACIEGLVINLFYPNPIAYLPKDLLIGFLYLGLMSNGQARGGSVAQFAMPFVLFSAVCVLYVAVPTVVTPVGISVALKQRLYYIPLMFAGYHFLRGDADLARLLRVIAWSSIPVSLFGVYLYFGGPMALRTMGAEYSHIFLSTMGESGSFFYRVPGTFNSPGQFGAYLYTVCTLLVGFLLVKGLAPSDRRMILLALACAIPAMLATGSRTPLLLFLLLAGLVAMLSREMSRAGVIAGLLYVIIVISLNYLGTGVAERVGSIATQENVERFTGTFFGQLWFTQMLASPMGEGLGVATIGARHFSPAGTVRLVESYLGILSTEMGALGVAAFLGLAVPIGIRVVQARAWMTHAPGRPIWVAIFFLTLVNLALTSNSTALDAIPGNLYFWFFLGIAFKMVDLERTRLMWTQEPSHRPGRSDA
jgi:hypothetical protein